MSTSLCSTTLITEEPEPSKAYTHIYFIWIKQIRKSRMTKCCKKIDNDCVSTGEKKSRKRKRDVCVKWKKKLQKKNRTKSLSCGHKTVKCASFVHHPRWRDVSAGQRNSTVSNAIHDIKLTYCIRGESIRMVDTQWQPTQTNKPNKKSWAFGWFSVHKWNWKVNEKQHKTTKRNETKRNETKNETKRNETKQHAEGTFTCDWC